MTEDIYASFFTQDTVVKEVFFMQTRTLLSDSYPILSKRYWKDAAKCFEDPKMLAYAALIVALRVIVKMFKIPIASGISLSFDCYFNSLGSVVYGPLMGLLVGAVSDTIGCILFPSPTGPYFFPFILVEMASSFIFALFLWRREIGILRSVTAKFCVNFVCNIVLTSVFMKWMYSVFYTEKTYPLINLVRIVKNLVLFPFESVLIAIIISAAMPALKSAGLIKHNYCRIDTSNKLRLTIITLLYLLISIAIILFYVFFLKDFVASHNKKFF